MNLFEIYESMGKLDNKEIIAVITKGANILGEREFASQKAKQPIALHAFGEKPKVVKSANQQRAELIELARVFVEGQKTGPHGVYEVEDKSVMGFLSPWQTNVEFIVNTKKRTVVALMRGVATGSIYAKGIAKCMPGDVFNADIGKAIALAKALQIEIPREFLDAVQPDEFVVGMVIEAKTGTISTLEHRDSRNDGYGYGEAYRLTTGTWLGTKQIKEILDDTNAEYRVRL